MKTIQDNNLSQLLQNTQLIYPEFNSSYINVILVDKHVPDYNQFVNATNSSTYPIVYSYSSSKTELINILKNFTSITRLCLVFSKNTGNTKLFLDRKPLFTDTPPYSENMEFIINIIKEFNIKHIDFLACDTLNYPSWVNYYDILYNETKVIVGASNNKTGNIKRGDWNMESTNENIELIYFTKSIEYYKYLLDPPINTDHILHNFTGDDGALPYSSVVFNGSTLYGVSSTTIYSYNIISRNFNVLYNIPQDMFFFYSRLPPILNNHVLYSIGYPTGPLESYYGILYSYNLITNTFTILHTFYNSEKGSGLTLNDSILYGTNITENNEGYLYAFNIITSVYTQLYNFTNINTYNLLSSVIFYNNHLLYGTSSHDGLNGYGYIYTFDIISSEFNIIYNFTYSDGFQYNIGVFNGTTLYGSTSTTLYSYDIITQVFTILYDSLQSGASPIILINNILYGIEIDGGSNSMGSIFSYNLYTNNFIIQYSFTERPDGVGPYSSLVLHDGILYGTTIEGGTSGSTGGFTGFGTLYAFYLSDICLIGSTLINTDQGIIRIDQMNTFNTIRNRKIIAITKTLCQDKYLACFEKNALGRNIPSEQTIMSLGHCVKYNEEMVKAIHLVGRNSRIYKILSKGECLYNILMEKYQTVLANNLTVETLHPTNKLAKKILNKNI